ncbi:DNA polymerase III subunit delta [Streptococcus sp. sy018]|uniref:DNA polymerase III subunit delta n=1 Tax=Streptococcus sp. sy018 TaxID=2600147 RepID=UPI0011B840C9|nr:DNA polymerase III subunit delta [Streptococcus sp. sy018]TWS95469.1 DNA polymerase III subunit delta [Streptococcus sp. sy018]
MIILDKIKKLKASQLPPILVLAGDDLGQYQECKAALLASIGFEASDLTYSYFDLEETSFEQAALDLESLPFFADEKIVIFDNFFDMTTNKKNILTDMEMKQFESYLANPVVSTRLIICCVGKLDGKRRLVKLLKRDGLVFEAESLKEPELRAYIDREAQALGLTFTSGALEQLLLKSNFDFSTSLKNLLFLKTYKGKEKITSTDVNDLLPKSLQDNIFDLTQFVLQAKLLSARELAHDLTLQGEDVIKLIAVMLGQIRFFAQLKTLQSMGKAENQLISDLSDYLGRKVNPYQIKFALRDMRHYSLDFLQESMKILIETDYQIKQGRYEKDYLFDLALLKISQLK